jgi:hypothetical protein
MTRGVLAVCVLLLASTLVGGVAAGTTAGAPPPTFTQQDFDRTEFRIQVSENGSARWTFTFVRRLDSADERDAFEEYAAQFETEETTLYTNFRENARELTAQGTEETGREMTATSFTRTAFVDEGLAGSGDERGLVRISFLWRSFAATEGDRVIVGDVFEGGFYIGPDQSLVFAPGPGVAFDSVDPVPDSQGNPESLPASDSVTWQGEESFADQRPRLVLVPEGSAGASATASSTATGAGTGTETGTPASAPDGGDGRGVGLLGWLALGVVLVVGVGAGYAYRSGRFGDDGGAATADSTDGADGGGAAAESAGEASDGAAAAADIDEEELLSDEDRVVSMLEERGGRMKQVNIVEETGWSKSKVSMLLSEMEEEEQLSKLRVGRENIVSLAGHEPEAAKSPFDDDE